ncbi:TRAPP trafficking subunit Trs65-domain-containing protein [Pisolithus orientalis]|uniref:TRAPP trafficking subunit Trs65-domain-containing protein n=1 Tax=Pisolithus orientalis TaxID=936130 RepID=UPI002224D308|nr:TRAPP trafficking subunit Trs65-domain-containing protein [Pisolithus orientalis]KAI6033223.1 TRAPP trafficking subunit Trs65-domain-containing protein [Pisolithus orientalis]
MQKSVKEEPSFETLFGACLLEVVVPNTSVDFPKRQDLVDDWLTALQERQADRKHAFFDEQLRLFLIIKINLPPNSPHESRGLPPPLVHFLRHIQVSLDATYISRNNPRPTSLHPSIFPPTTPNPIPSTAEADKKYVQSEGALLHSSIWGQDPAEHSGEKFAVFFSHSRREWVAVYRLFLNVSFLRLPFTDPLLCLTISATLREKPLPLSQTRHPLVAFLLQEDMMPWQDVIAHRPSIESDDPLDMDYELNTLKEVNLLDGLATGSSHSSESELLDLPSTRLGDVTRRQLFCLPPVFSLGRTSQGINTVRGPHHVLRKSFRVVLEMASGFRVRMRTVFAPHILLPMDQSTLENVVKNGDEEWEAGNSERTIVLCIEIENSGEYDSDVGFSLERVDVKIGGDGAITKLVGWGEAARHSNSDERTFPLFLKPKEQYNLLYMVSFLNADNQDDISFTAPSAKLGVLQRAVTISVHGRPYISNFLLDEGKGSNVLTYLTRAFSSRWNCILDMSSRPREGAAQWQGSSSGTRSALPELPSPFPGAFPSAIVPPPTTRPVPQAVAGKRLTMQNNITALHTAGPLSSLPRDQSSFPISVNQTPPSVSLQRSSDFPHLTSSVPPPTPAMRGLSEARPQGIAAPATPALTVGQGVNSISGLMGSRQGIFRASTSIESRTEQDSFVLHTTSPACIGRSNATGDAPISSVEPIIVSLDIFVFNQSSWTRRFQVSYPNANLDQRRKIVQDRVNMIALDELKSTVIPPGILPLQNRVRVGPLKPSTCQSVRLDFLALSPGVHSVNLTLVDVETGYLMNLRSAIDIVVHEAWGIGREIHLSHMQVKTDVETA